MRFTVVVAVLFAIAMVTMANRANKLKKLKKKAMAQKMQRQQQDVCDVITWGPCENGKITQFVAPNTTNPACSGAIIDSTSIQHTMDCVTVTVQQFKKCNATISRNFTTCQNNGEFYTVEKTFDCEKKSHKNTKEPMKKPCGVRIKDKMGPGAGAGKAKGKGKGRGKGKGKNNNNKMLGKRKEKKQFRKRLMALKAQGCEYKKTTCTGKQMKWTLKEGGQDCEKELQGPCFGAFKRKNTRRQRGGKRRA